MRASPRPASYPLAQASREAATISAPTSVLVYTDGSSSGVSLAEASVSIPSIVYAAGRFVYAARRVGADLGGFEFRRYHVAIRYLPVVSRHCPAYLCPSCRPIVYRVHKRHGLAGGLRWQA